jgi:radical SAM superfamily enzyme YgiQ (UPF0313 family)
MTTLDVLLVNIPITVGKKDYDTSIDAMRSLNFGLLSIASNLSAEGYTAYVMDLQSFEGDPVSQLLDHIERLSPNIVGFSCVSGFGYAAFKKVSSAVKDRFPDVFTVAGGKDHVGRIARDVLSECDWIDVVVKGEGEETLRDILCSRNGQYDLSRIPNITCRINGQVHDTPVVEEFGSSPQIPRLNYHLYHDFRHFAPCVEVSRGCPYNCSFCVASRSSVIKKGVDAIVDEVAELCDFYDDKYLKLYFETPMFFRSAQELRFLCELRKRSGFKFTWRTETRIEYLSLHNIQLLVDAGARVVDVGLESASPDILSRMGKTNSPEEYLEKASEAIINADKTGLKLKLNILFFLGEDLDTLRTTFQFLDNHSGCIAGLSAYPLFKYPGMRLEKRGNGYIEQFGGAVVEGPQWRNLHVNPIDLSQSISYERASEVGVLFGKAFQTIEQFYFQKQYGYLVPNTTYDAFESQVESIGLLKFPFSATHAEMMKHREILRDMLQG